MSPLGSAIPTLAEGISCGIRGRRAITTWGSALTLLALLVGTEAVVIRAGAPRGEPAVVAASIVVAAVSGGVPLVGRLAIGRARARGAASAVAVFLSLGGFHALLLDSLPWMRLTGWSLLELVVADAVLSLIWMSMAAGTLANFDLYLLARDSVREQKDALATRRAELIIEQNDYRDSLERVVRETVFPAIDRCAVELDGFASADAVDADGLRALAVDLRNCAESVARRTSHALWDTDPKSAGMTQRREAIGRRTGVVVETSFRRIVATVMRVKPFAPVGTGFLTALLGLPSLLLAFGWIHGAAAAMVAGLAAAAVLTVASATCTGLARRLGFGKRGTLVLAWYGGAAVAAGMASRLGLSSFEPILWIWIPELLVVVVVAAGWASAMAVGHMRRGLDMDVSAMESLRSWEAARQAKELIVIRDRVASCLHGLVQGRLTAAALQVGMAADRVERGEPQGSDEVASALRVAREGICDGKEGLASALKGEATRGIREQLEGIAAAWAGAVAVRCILTEDAAVRVNGSAMLTAAVKETVEEGVSNAACHGLASSVLVRLEQEADQCAVSVADNGIGPSPDFRSGHGLRAITASAGSVSLERGATGGAVLTATFPMDVPLGGAPGAKPT